MRVFVQQVGGRRALPSLRGRPAGIGAGRFQRAAHSSVPDLALAGWETGFRYRKAPHGVALGVIRRHAVGGRSLLRLPMRKRRGKGLTKEQREGIGSA